MRAAGRLAELLCGAALLGALNLNLPAAEFIAGADISHLAFFEERGVVYREEGQVKDLPVLLKQCGLNCARLRLFTSNAQQAKGNPYNSINNLEYTLPLAA